MGKKDMYLTMPSFFKCPISLDVMKSPVSLSTGVTYDRDNIQRWLDSGHDTCPATMQVLDSKLFVPNHTLHRLIQTWSNNNNQHFNSPSFSQIHELFSRVSDSYSTQTRLESLVKILRFASESEGNCNFLSSNEKFVSVLVGILGSDSPDPNPNPNPNLLETVLKIVQLVVKSIVNDKQKHKLILHSNHNLIPNLTKILKSTGLGSRLILKSVLSTLISLTSIKQNKIKLIKCGGVQIIGNIISNIDDNVENHLTIEFLITLLEMLVGCLEGRVSISGDPNCVPGIMRKLMKVSMVGNEHIVAILWSLCYYFRDQNSKEVVIKSNGGLSKILLMMQSNCSPAVKKMCCDLLRIFRVNFKSCLSSYDTKTTHIMPC
ncbi:hypothetical protein RND81_13G210400 [Saponaria officinalis]|uniref:U-box domain-containing protein n=1 Tax=Saponaria officinalis TaxID=3572 RepID=A0AAW1H0F8_SAPOF